MNFVLLPRVVSVLLARPLVVLVVAGVVAAATACGPQVPPGGLPCDPAVLRCPRDVTGSLPGATSSSGGSVVDIADSGEMIVNGPGGVYRLPRQGGARPLPGLYAGGGPQPRAVNSHGLVAGRAQAVPVGRYHPVVWHAQDRVLDLAPKLPTFGATFFEGEANGVSELGQVAGGYIVDVDGSSYARFAFVWDSRTDQVTVLNPEGIGSPQPSQVAAWQVSIGNGGVIATIPVNSTGSRDGMRWWPQADGSYRREDLAGRPNAINSRGEAVGIARGEPVFWPADSSEAVRLPTLADRSGRYFGYDINDSGVIVGVIENSLTDRVPIWWPARASEPPRILGGGGATAQAVNNRGTIGGTGIVPVLIGQPSGFRTRALVWD
jgi:uncharacterized membrane protein